MVLPFVSAYLGLMGAVVLWKALRRSRGEGRPPRNVPLLGFAGGFLDAIGGGGWGPMVASTLVGRGMKTRVAIGSTNAAEFLVTTTISAMFVFTIGLELWPIITGLVLGGVIAGVWGLTAPWWFAFAGAGVTLALVWRSLEQIAHADESTPAPT